MKNFSNLKTNLYQRKTAVSLLLTAILSISGGLTFINNSAASANPVNAQQRNIQNTKIKPVPIPKNELPPPLDKGVVFREISSGGITGAIYQTVLLNDGILTRVRIGDANDSERSVRRVSSQELKQFQRLLKKNNISRYNNLSYLSYGAAADYITYTLTSKEGTFQYNDLTQNGLPNKLQSVVSAWNQLKNNAKPL
ncbi:hypothetical protein A0J48_009355 [Sphaerospermopsis aphanizomenoides BCCUSP55]|uniref:hypothetical protein n=1 Tax=Sphaerospermopsis aphanizomenoides TaxID=459663 RepID=UPI00190301E4|nr:hypothetical protein [Sphaerospermopsis aphanizomenoides]MBK1987740.1 hypothetical protein [Sphaerospermopsis aphanizomenoides BCCUSP55]